MKTPQIVGFVKHVSPMVEQLSVVEFEHFLGILWYFYNILKIVIIIIYPNMEIYILIWECIPTGS